MSSELVPGLHQFLLSELAAILPADMLEDVAVYILDRLQDQIPADGLVRRLVDMNLESREVVEQLVNRIVEFISPTVEEQTFEEPAQVPEPEPEEQPRRRRVVLRTGEDSTHVAKRARVDDSHDRRDDRRDDRRSDLDHRRQPASRQPRVSLTQLPTVSAPEVDADDAKSRKDVRLDMPLTAIQDPSADRCKYWPNCTRMDSCHFYHPTEKCKFWFVSHRVVSALIHL